MLQNGKISASQADSQEAPEGIRQLALGTSVTSGNGSNGAGPAARSDAPSRGNGRVSTAASATSPSSNGVSAATPSEAPQNGKDRSSSVRSVAESRESMQPSAGSSSGDQPGPAEQTESVRVNAFGKVTRGRDQIDATYEDALRLLAPFRCNSSLCFLS